MPRRRKDALNDDKLCIKNCRTSQPIVQRCAANARERSRMRILSKAFSKLKTTLPWVPADTKLSKLDTLRLASSYIAHLQQILDTDDSDSDGQPPVFHPLNLTWPFSFQGGKAGPGSDGKSPEHMKSPLDQEMSPVSDITM